ncbi:hypothetical protein BDA96_01G283400 [Sorghum bicolor]|uniref:Uncharacterized protein n=1 Tax=Sorghum bicolor TaxID=4558 RepID=A0A921S0A1_SORBI|nr:hypothetical protein BDA96_01G283400 [Sorghum bicolor]
MFLEKTNVVTCHRSSLAEEIQDCCYAEPCGRLPSACLLLAAWPSNAVGFSSFMIAVIL